MNTNKISKTMLFKGMYPDEIDKALTKLTSIKKKYKKGSRILSAGKTTERMGLVLEGSVTIESNDIWGNRTILSHIGEGQFFAETYSLLPDEPLLVDVNANEDCTILFLRTAILHSYSSENWAMKLTSNLLMISSHKNLNLSGRSFHTSPKSIRGRVMAYLNSVMLKQGTNEFDIPFDRQQLADYLNVERTALSKELAKMQDDGIIRFRKNHFIVDSE